MRNKNEVHHAVRTTLGDQPPLVPIDRRLARPNPHPLANPLIVGLLVFGSVAVVGLVVALGMVAMRPTVNVAHHGGKIDNSPSANVEVSPESGR